MLERLHDFLPEVKLEDIHGSIVALKVQLYSWRPSRSECKLHPLRLGHTISLPLVMMGMGARMCCSCQRLALIHFWCLHRWLNFASEAELGASVLFPLPGPDSFSDFSGSSGLLPATSQTRTRGSVRPLTHTVSSQEHCSHTTIVSFKEECTHP